MAQYGAVVPLFPAGSTKLLSDGFVDVLVIGYKKELRERERAREKQCTFKKHAAWRAKQRTIKWYVKMEI